MVKILKVWLVGLISLVCFSVEAKDISHQLMDLTACSRAGSGLIKRLCLGKLPHDSREFLTVAYPNTVRVYELRGKAGVAPDRLGYFRYEGYRSYIRVVGSLSPIGQLLEDRFVVSPDGNPIVGTALIERDGSKILSITFEPRIGQRAKADHFPYFGGR